MSSTLVINGSTVNLNANDTIIKGLTVYRKGSYPTLSFERRGVSVGAINTDTWNGKTVSLTLADGTLVFQGDVVSVDEQWTGIGYVLSYQALGMRNRGDWFPHTNETDNQQTTAFNLLITDPNYNAALAGRTVGQILTTVFTMTQNTAAMTSYGLSYGEDTISDLASMTVIPVQPVYFGGEKFLGAVESFLAQWAPNYTLWVQPNGELRFLNLMAFEPVTLTLGHDLVEPPSFTRDCGDSYSAVVVRGAPWVMPVLLTTANGGLLEDFTWGSYTTNAAAIAAWTPSDFNTPGSTTSAVSGSCVCNSTTTITITPSPGTFSWVADYWDQTITGRHGYIYLNDSSLPDVNQYVSCQIVANTALSTGGSCTLTISQPLNYLNYTSFQIYGLTGNGSIVWRQYSIASPQIADALATQFAYPVPFVSSTGAAATLTSVPTGTVVGPNNEEFPDFLTVYPQSGTILFSQPTSMIFGNAQAPIVPTDVRALLAVNTTENTVRVPSSGYAGTCYTHDGLEKVLTVSVPQWTDPGSLTQMQTYAQDLLYSVQDTVISGQVVYLGLLEDVLSMGVALNLAANYGSWETVTTGFESMNIPIVAVELHFLQGSGSIYETVISCSNRRSHYTADNFLRPQRPMVLPQFGGEGAYNVTSTIANQLATPNVTGGNQATFDAQAEQQSNIDQGIFQ